MGLSDREFRNRCIAVLLVIAAILGIELVLRHNEANQAQAASPQRFQYVYIQQSEPRVWIIKDTATGACWVGFNNYNTAPAPKEVCEVK